MHTFCKWAGFVFDAPGKKRTSTPTSCNSTTRSPTARGRAFTHFTGTGRLACPRASPGLSEAEIMDKSKSKSKVDRGP